MTTLMTSVTYGPFFSAQYDKDLPDTARPYVIHHPYRLIDGKVILSSWDEIEPIIAKDGSIRCLCRINLEKAIEGTAYFENVDPVPTPIIDIDQEYVDNLKDKAQRLFLIAEKVELQDVSADDAKVEVDAIADELKTAVVEPRIP